MEFFRRNRLLSFLLLGALFLVLVLRFISPQYLNARFLAQVTQDSTTPAETSSSTELGNQIDTFLGDLGAEAFIVWQYSGDSETAAFGEGANDKYSFYKDTPKICDVLKEKSTKYPGKIGVNMHAITKFPATIDSTLDHLAGCGVSIIRTWATSDRSMDNIGKIMESAKNHNMKVILVIDDFANGIGPTHADPTSWYSNEYKGEYTTHLKAVTAAFGNHEALYAIELLNEPHCKGHETCVQPYNNWAAQSASIVKNLAGAKVGLGQMANNDLGRGDSPGNGDFAQSNRVADVTSGHYYTTEEMEKVKEALKVAKQIGKPFYIGEAPADLKTSAKGQYFEYNIQRADYETTMKSFMDQYSVTCLPKADLQLAIQNGEKCNEVPGGCANWNTRGELAINADGKLLGLLRNQTKADERSTSETAMMPESRFESIEAFLSVRNQQPAGVTTDSKGMKDDVSPYQAPIYTNLSLTEQCEVIKKKVAAVKDLCLAENRIEGDKTACALDKEIGDQKGNTGFNHTQLYDALQTNSCQQVMEKSEGNKYLEKIKRAVLATNPAMEIAYRPAFIVMVTKTDNQTDSLNPNITTPGAESAGIQQVDYLEIKVPTLLSDYGLPGEGESLVTKNTNISSYRDPARVTADLFTTPDYQEKWADLERKERGLIKQNSDTYTANKGPTIGGLNAEMPVRCRNTKGELDECDDAVEKALLHFINSSTIPEIPERTALSPYGEAWKIACRAEEADFYPKKDNRQAETATEIGTKLEAEEKVGDYTKKKSAKAEVQARVDLDRPQGNGGVTTQIFFVTPHKYNLEYTHAALLSYAKLNDQLNYLQTEKFPEELKVELNSEFTDSPDTRGRERPTIPGQTPDPNAAGGVSVQVGMDHKQDKNPILWRLAGNVANIPTRLFTLMKTEKSDPYHRYTISCRGESATEDWLTNKCGDTNEGEDPGDTTGVDQYCIEWEMNPDDPRMEAIKETARQKLASFGAPDGYTLDHPRNTPYYEDRYQQVIALNAQGLNGSNGLPLTTDKINFFENFYGGGRALLWTKHPDCGGQVCYDYVMDKCAQAGINPGLCIAISLSESGGLNHIRFPDSYDFGCKSAEPANISQGVKCLTNDFFSHHKGEDYNTMFVPFAAPNGLKSASYSRIEQYYTQFAGQIAFSDGACKPK